MMHTSYSDPAVAAFVVIPVLLAALLVWSAARATTTRMSFLVLVAVIIWMSGTWIAADNGVAAANVSGTREQVGRADTSLRSDGDMAVTPGMG